MHGSKCESCWRYLGTALSSTRRLPVFCMLHMPRCCSSHSTCTLHSNANFRKLCGSLRFFNILSACNNNRQQATATSNNNNFKLRTWRFFLKIFMLAQRLHSPQPLPLPLCLCALPAPVELFMVIGKIFLCVFLFAGNKTKALSANTTLERDTLGPLQLQLRLQLQLELEWLVVIMQFSSLFAEGATFRP